MAAPAARAGGLLQRLVNTVSHGSSGRTLALMNDATVTLHQVMLLVNVLGGSESPSKLARAMSVSMAAVTQNVDRLVRKGLLVRAAEDSTDRRQRKFRVTNRARALLSRLEVARSEEYGSGLSRLKAPLLEELIRSLEPIVEQLESTKHVAEVRAAERPRRSRARAVAK
jgi:DNA-binding MarR family transcriptional regulator